MVSLSGLSEGVPRTEGYFSQVAQAPASSWLLGAGGEEASGRDYPYQVLQYFREVSNDVKHWLSEYQEKHQVSSVHLLSWSHFKVLSATFKY